MEKRDDPLSEGKSVALPLPHLIFKISTEASVSSRLYCRAYTAITFLRGAGRCLRAQVYACVVNAISSFLILLPLSSFCEEKKGCNLFFSFFINKWTERRMERRMFAFFFDSINKDDFVYGVRSLARRLRDRCCLRII